MPNKGFAFVAAGQFETRLQELGLQGSYLDGSWQAMPSITTFLTTDADPGVSSVSKNQKNVMGFQAVGYKKFKS